LRPHEKSAFLRFFLMYFLSVAVLVLVAGFFYFAQTKDHLLKQEEFSLLEYARHLKMGGPGGEFSRDFRHRLIPSQKHIDIRNFTVGKDTFTKRIPLKIDGRYLEVTKSKKSYDQKIRALMVRIIAVQILLFFLFGLISYRLAKNAIKPLEESIELLDHFAKDLIHDLNTPVTSIKLNMNILERLPDLKSNKAFSRVKKSVQSISELHENLTILLEEKTFQMKRIDVCSAVQEVVEIEKPLYPDIDFQVRCQNFHATLNPKAFRQILQNIISNACRYNIPGGYVKIYRRHNALYIEDSGKGIQNPEKIFEREYSDEKSSGLGLDIVKRLAMAMQIDVQVLSNQPQGTVFILTMR